MSTALTTRDTHAIEPRDFAEAFRMAEVLFNSHMFPDSCKNPESAMLILLKGRELGIPTMQAMTEIAVVKGKVQLSANLMVGLCLRSGAAEYFACAETSAEVATYRTKRRDDPTGEKVYTYTIAEAKVAGLVRKGEKGPGVWEAHPADMLRARAASKLARMVYPDVLAGCYTPDEIEDFDRPTAPGAQRVQAETPPSLPPVPALPTPQPVPIDEVLQQIQAAPSAPALDEIREALNKGPKRQRGEAAQIRDALKARAQELAAAEGAKIWSQQIAEAQDSPTLDQIRGDLVASALTEDWKRALMGEITHRRAALGRIGTGNYDG